MTLIEDTPETSTDTTATTTADSTGATGTDTTGTTGTAATSTGASSGAMVMRIVRGQPNEEEIAAATMALLTLFRNRAASARTVTELTAVAAWAPARNYMPPGSWASPE